MREILNRFFVIIAGLCLAWTTVWGASNMCRSSFVNLTEIRVPALITFGILGFICAMAIICFLIFLFNTLWSEDDYGTIAHASGAAFAAVCAAFLFGAIVQPVWEDGVGAWETPWAFVLILGFLPTAFTIKEIFLDILSMYLKYRENRPGPTLGQHD